MSTSNSPIPVSELANRDSAPRRIPVARRFVKLGLFPREDIHLILLEAVTDQPATGPMEHWTDDGGSWWGPGRVAPSFRTGGPAWLT